MEGIQGRRMTPKAKLRTLERGDVKASAGSTKTRGLIDEGMRRI